MRTMARPLLLLMFALTAALVFWLGRGNAETESYAAGRAEAEQDLTAGRLRLRCTGLKCCASETIERMVWDKLGVKFETVGGCVSYDSELMERKAGYNERMKREIDRQYGTDAVEKLADGARAEYYKEHDAGHHDIQ